MLPHAPLTVAGRTASYWSFCNIAKICDQQHFSV